MSGLSLFTAKFHGIRPAAVAMETRLIGGGAEKQIESNDSFRFRCGSLKRVSQILMGVLEGRKAAVTFPCGRLGSRTCRRSTTVSSRRSRHAIGGWRQQSDVLSSHPRSVQERLGERSERGCVQEARRGGKVWRAHDPPRASLLWTLLVAMCLRSEDVTDVLTEEQL